MKYHFYFYVEAALITAILVLLAMLLSVFLSSAEAHRGLPSKSVTLPVLGHVNGFPDARLRHAGVIYEAPRSAFEKSNEPVKWLFQWPWLPSVDEVRIKMAKEKLAMEIASKEEMKPFQWPFDWEALKRALGLALIAAGVMISIMYGRTAIGKKNPI